MRIAFYSPLTPPDHFRASGDRQMAAQLLTLFRMAGHEAEIISPLRTFTRTPSPDHLAMLEEAAAGEIARIRHHWARQGPSDLWFTYHPYFKSPDLIGPTLASEARIPYMTANASYAPRRDREPWAPYQASVAEAVRLARFNLCYTPRDAAGLVPVAGSASTVKFPPFIDLAPAPRLPRREGPPVIVTVGMARPGRKLANFRAMSGVLSRTVEEPWILDVIGGGPCKEEAAGLFAHFPPGRVRFRGELPRDEVFRVMAAGDLYFWPGHEEAYGLSYLEASAHGLPVAAWDDAGVPAVVNHGETGLLAPYPDETALAAVVVQLLRDAPLRQRLGEAGRRMVLQSRSMEQAVGRLSQLLDLAVEVKR